MLPALECLFSCSRYYTTSWAAESLSLSLFFYAENARASARNPSSWRISSHLARFLRESLILAIAPLSMISKSGRRIPQLSIARLIKEKREKERKSILNTSQYSASGVALDAHRALCQTALAAFIGGSDACRGKSKRGRCRGAHARIVRPRLSSSVDQRRSRPMTHR